MFVRYLVIDYCLLTKGNATLTAVASVCSLAWFGSLGVNIALWRRRKGDAFLFERHLTRRGTIYVPQLQSFWPFLQLLCFVSAQISIFYMIYNGYQKRPLVFGFPFRKLISLFVLKELLTYESEAIYFMCIFSIALLFIANAVCTIL